MGSDGVCLVLFPLSILFALAAGLATAIGIAAEIVGNIIFKTATTRPYTTLTTATSIGIRGGSTGYIIGGACCIPIIMFTRIGRYLPIITLPFWVMGGAITGVVGFACMLRAEREYLVREEGFGSGEALRAGAVGGAVVGAVVLIIGPACYWGWVLWKKMGEVDWRPGRLRWKGGASTKA